MNTLSKTTTIGLTALLVALTGLMHPQPLLAQANLPLSQEPIFIANRIKPNFILAIDDSGSMDFETSVNANDGSLWWHAQRQSFYGLDLNNQPVNGAEIPNFNGAGDGTNNEWKKYTYLFPSGTGADGKALGDGTNGHFAIPPTIDFGYTRSPDYNFAYFNPLVKYDPWERFNGAEFDQINPTSAPADPSRGTVRFNLTTDQLRTGAGFEFMFHVGMRIPQGTWYRVSACHNGAVNPTNTRADALGPGQPTGGFRIASVNRTLTRTGTDGRARCSIAIGYFPATFFVRDVDGRANAIAAEIGYLPSAIDRTARSPGDAAGAGRQVMARFEIKPNNFSSTPQYTAAINNFANWFSYYRKRHLAARAGLTQSFSGVDFVNVGYFTINNRNNVTMRDLALPTDRQALYNQFLSLTPNGGTPNREAIEHLGQQFRRTGPTAPIRLACQKNFGMLFTDGFSNPTTATNHGNVDGPFPAPFRDTVSDTAADIAMRHYLDNLRPDLPSGKVPTSPLCDSPEPPLYLNCRKDPHMTFYAVTLGSRGLVYNPDLNQDPFTAPFPVWPTTFPARHPSAVDDLWHATINARGRMLNARTPREITDAIRSVLTAVQDSSVPAGRNSASGARVTADSFFVIPSFSVRFNGTDWSGSLIAYRLNRDGTIGAPLWNGNNGQNDAAMLLPDHADRNLFVATRAGDNSTRQVSFLTASSLGSDANAQYNALGLTSADLAIHPGITPTRAVNYLRGDKSHEQVFSAGGVLESGTFRRRTSNLGSIVNSIPVIFTGKENFGYGALPNVGNSYLTFLQNRRTQTPMIYVGANAGFLHAFNGNTGVEAWGFAPQGSLNNMGRLLNPSYQHRYYVDGLITVSDAQRNGSWGTFLVAGSGGGARNLMAMDVTNPTSVGPSNVLWELSGNSTPDLGHIYSRPMILPVRGTGTAPRWVVISGNGYNSTNGRPALLVIDLASGQIIANIKPTTTDPNTNGLGNIVAIPDAEGYVSTVYSGDLAGNVWKFNLSGSNPANWGVALGGAPLFQARDANNNPQPITGGFDVAKGPNNGTLVFFGTGRYISTNDNQITSSSQRQSLYAVLDRGTPITGGRTSLATRSINGVTAGGEVRTRSVSDGVVNFTTQNGWVLDLIVGTDMRGELFSGFPRVEGGIVYYSTFEPVGDSCTPGGVNWLYGLNTLTGTSALSNLRIPGNDSDGDGTPDELCTGSACGAIEMGSGAPVPEPVILVPEPDCIPGTLNCPIPNTCESNPGDPNCVAVPTQDSIYDGCVKIISVGGRQISQPRPCGRQSWRQVR